MAITPNTLVESNWEAIKGNPEEAGKAKLQQGTSCGGCHQKSVIFNNPNKINASKVNKLMFYHPKTRRFAAS